MPLRGGQCPNLAVIPIPQSRERNLALVPACNGKNRGEIPRWALSKVTLSTSFPRKRESTRHGSPLTRGRRRLLLSSPWVGRRPMTTRNDSSGRVRPSIKLGHYPNDGKRRQGAKKDVKIEGTNSTSPLESTKVSKNELKTNWFLRAKKANQSQNSGP